MCEVKGIHLKQYELESLLKSFLLFFILILSLYLSLVWQNYKEQRKQIDSTVLHEMQIFSYKPLSGAFDVSFVLRKKNTKTIAQLYSGVNDPYALFEIPGSEIYLLKVTLPKKKYQERLQVLTEKIYTKIYWYLLLIIIVALLLAYYTLYPLKKALQINEEFVRDILHDINTPLSSLLINLNMLTKRFGQDRGFERMKNSIETIQNLQSNLKSFLYRQPKILNHFSLYTLIESRIEYFEILYPTLVFSLDINKHTVLHTNYEAFTRMIDNLLSNAAKYNVKHGHVTVVLSSDELWIEDTGIGIKNTDRVFERYYKEGERGLGLGLHIVKKLSKELGIDISLESRQGKGTRAILALSKVIHR